MQESTKSTRPQHHKWDANITKIYREDEAHLLLYDHRCMSIRPKSTLSSPKPRKKRWLGVRSVKANNKKNHISSEPFRAQSNPSGCFGPQQPRGPKFMKSDRYRIAIAAVLLHMPISICLFLYVVHGPPSATPRSPLASGTSGLPSATRRIAAHLLQGWYPDFSRSDRIVLHQKWKISFLVSWGK